MEYIECIWHV